MMARPWQAPRPLLAILVTLVALTYQARKKTFISIREVPAEESNAKSTLQFIVNEYNKESNDEYNFRIFRVLKILTQVTDHLEYHATVEMWRTTCRKSETMNCVPQEGELHKQIICNFSVFAVPLFEKYKIRSKNCSNG
ncbi:cystatin-11 [Nycticebus coucang]|uniref:cystatin-11 n=1 Tax=Nycticebus coucang TaxID=9470 RepID=UPI00234C3B35|nr:cystatin-11 [Nycticebus coucang]